MKRTLLAIAFCASACQTYDFEPVTPLAVGQTTQSKKIVAHQLKPNIMLLLDKSGSMATNTSTDNALGCPATIGGCGPTAGMTCAATCPTRITDLKKAMNTFLMTAGTVGRVGAAYFPKDTVCTPTSASEVLVQLPPPALADDDVANQMQADSVNSAIQANMPITPGGGTPTGASIEFVGTMQELQDVNRANFLLLLTDGVPNCNPNNVNTCSNAAACQCTLGGSACMGQFCSLGCLDATGAVGAINDLRNKGIKTIVVGFGACGAGSTSPDCANAPQTLNSMASAGGFARACPMGTDVECQTMGIMDTCNLATKLCNQSFYGAANAMELSAALLKISQAVGGSNICEYQLDAIPSDPRFLSVTVDGQSIQGCGESVMGAVVPGCNTWTYDQSTGVAKVTFQGSTCTKVEGATPQNPVNVDFRIVDSL